MMKRSFTQKEIYEFLQANPLGVAVHIGDLEDMQGRDYIFFDYFEEVPMLRDNEADYQSVVQISVLTKDYENRKALVDYIKTKFLITPSYSHDEDFDYYQAQFTTGVFIDE